MNENNEQMDPEVKEVTGSLVERLKLDKHQYPSTSTYAIRTHHHHHNTYKYQHSSSAGTSSSSKEPHKIEMDGNKSNSIEQRREGMDIKLPAQSPSSQSKSEESAVSVHVPAVTKAQVTGYTATCGCESSTSNANSNSNRSSNRSKSRNLVTNISSTNTNSSSGDDRSNSNGKEAGSGSRSSSSHPHPVKTLSQHQHNSSGPEDGKGDADVDVDLPYNFTVNNIAADEYIFKKVSSPKRFKRTLKTHTSPASMSDPSQDTGKDLKQNTNSNSNISSESKEFTSSDQSDGGYAASASSNDASAGTSNSISSSESYYRRKNHRSSHAKGAPYNKHKRDAYCSSDRSSDLADFSSGGSVCSSSNSSSPRISPFAAANLSEDSENSNAMNKTGKRNLFNARAVIPSPYSPRDRARHGSASASTSSVAGARGMERQNTMSSFPSRYRLRHYATKHKRDKEPGLKTTGLLSDASNPKSKSNTNSTNDPNYTMPNTWSFVERQLKRKMNFEDIGKKSYEDQRKELDVNFKTAVKRIRHLNSSCSLSSVKSSLTNGSDGQDALMSMPDYEKRADNSPIYDVGVDVMAKILRYLTPIEAYSILSTPISKTFKSTFSNPQDLWKVLCLSEPFYAKQDKDSDESTAYPICNGLTVNHLLDRYRLLYSSLIKCVRYLDRIQEDSRNGLTPSGAYESDNNSIQSYQENASLKNFFARAHSMKWKDASSNSEDDDYNSGIGYAQVEHTKKRHKSEEKKQVKLKFGASNLTNRLLGPAHSTGVAGNVSLPWSCAIYSVVNWMVAFADVAGIQLMCLKVLPDLLVDEQQRTSAQHAGLTDIVLRAMVLFPDMVQLHTAAFHTLVLLARPLGGKEGMLFHTSMVNASGLFNVGSSTGKSGIAIMLDSMKRFVFDEDLQAMSCWSMVNIALIPSQKVVLVRLGGISAAANAMIHHPHNAEVQFRALFALINLVIPTENLSDNPEEVQRIDEQVGGMNQASEIDMLNECMEQVTNLVVVAMKNFCASEAILNRACLVLHNLSLNEAYHRVLLLTPNCYQMLEWCIGNYRHDNVLQQSARGTLQRLQQTLSSDPTLREVFTETIREQQQQLAAGNARRDAVMAHEENSVLPNAN